MEKTYKCKFCNKEFKSGQSLGAHIINCKDNPNNHQKEFAKKRSENAKSNNPVEEHLLICPICNKEFTIKVSKKNFENGKYPHTCSRTCAGILSNQKSNLEEKNKKISESLKGKIKKLPKKPIEKTCEICGKTFIQKQISGGRFSNSRFCSKECRLKYFSSLAKENNFGGYKPNSIKKHHHGNYKGIHCDSSWELAYLVYNLEHNIPIKRCNVKRTYIFENEEKSYFPDFIVNENQIVEIKGYFDDFAKAKQEQNPDILILFENDLKDILEYVSLKYGKEFWKTLYS